MTDKLVAYYNNVNQPWGKLFYRIIWNQLPQLNNKKILDFGSGFGISANYFSDNNFVTAIEPNSDMLALVSHDIKYQQLVGSVDQLKTLESNSFDLIICHNVFEYVSDIKAIVKEFVRVLKDDGIISIVKHNHKGRIMQKIIFENNLDEALLLLNNSSSNSESFGVINYYDNKDLLNLGFDLVIDSIYGVRTFFGLQADNSIKYQNLWQTKMLELELSVSKIKEYYQIAFFNHIILKKKN